MATTPVTPAPEVEAAATENVVAHIEADTAVTNAQAEAAVAQAESDKAIAEARAEHAEEIVAPDDDDDAIEVDETWLLERFASIATQVEQLSQQLLPILSQIPNLQQQLQTVTEMLTALTAALIKPAVVTESTPAQSATVEVVTPQNAGDENRGAKTEQKTAARARRMI